MIVTLTPNPSLDRTIEIASLRRGEVQRATAVHVDPGGKGVNLSRALAANDQPTRAVLPCGGAEGDQLRALLAEQGLELAAVDVDAAVRTNVTVVEPDGTTTKLNAPGAPLTPAEAEALVARTVDTAAGARWVACSGSLPPGLSDAFYADLVTRLDGTGAAVAVDGSGAPLRATLDARPDLVKPNVEELAEACGQAVETIGDAVDAGADLRTRGVGAVLVSLGADGAVLVDAGGALYGWIPSTRVRSTVGAGDALLAGFLSVAEGGREQERDREGAWAGRRRALAEGLAWAAAAVALPGTRMPGPDDIDRTAVRLLDDLPAERHLAPS
ncbi:MAG: 1-phosphofructokinase [Actinobacteria bacterium]|nr:1-phosphofructokinase [Actinomycetota bacterium]